MADATYQDGHYAQQGGTRKVVASGGSLDVESGGEIDIESGGSLKIAGTAYLLDEAAVTQNLSASAAVAADVLPIPVTAEVVSKTTGADAEALTLADGSPGQFLHIVLAVDGGGVGTLTPTTTTGFSTIVFADALDRATLKFVDATVGWIIWGLSGVAAPPATT